MNENEMNDDHEDVLRRVLREESSGVTPGPGAWERIESGVATARRRRHRGARTMVALGTAAAVLVGVVTVSALTGDDGTEVEAGPADRPVPPTTAPDGGEAGGEGSGGVAPVDTPGIWPFRTGPESDSISTDAWNDPVFTAERFLRDYVGFTRLVMGEFAAGDSRSGEVTATSRRGGPVTTVFVRRLGKGEPGPWTVIGAAADNIRVERPTALEEVTSPVHVKGLSTAFEGNVVVEVREDGQTAADGELGLTPLTGGSMGNLGPLVGDVPFGPTDAAGGAVVAYTDSAMDGAVEEASVVRVRFATPRSLEESTRLIAFDETRRELVVVGDDGRVGKVLTRLTDGLGFGGLAVSPDRKTVWLSEIGERGSSVCSATTRLVRVDGADPPGTTPGQARPGPGPEGRQPALSPNGFLLAVAADRECDGADELVVRDLLTGKEQPFADLGDPLDSPRDGRDLRISHLSWSPDGQSIAYEVEYADGRRGIQIHDVKAGAVTGDTRRIESKDPARIWLRPALYSADLMAVAVASGDDPGAGPTVLQTVRWHTGEELPDIGGETRQGLDLGVAIRSMAYRGIGIDGAGLIVAAGDGTIIELPLGNGQVRRIASGDYLAVG